MKNLQSPYEVRARKFLEKTGTEMHIVFTGTRTYFPDDTKPRDVYSVTLVRGNKSFTFEFGDSYQNTEHHTLDGHLRRKPTAYDILACLTKYEPEELDMFAEEMGITKPSEAIRIHKAVSREYDAIVSMYNGKELEALREIQ